MLLSMQFSLWTPLRQVDLNGFIPSLHTYYFKGTGLLWDMTGCYFGPTQPLDSESSRQIEPYFAHRQVRLNSGLEPPIPYPMMVGLETILKWRSLLTPTPPRQCNHNRDCYHSQDDPETQTWLVPSLPGADAEPHTRL